MAGFGLASTLGLWLAQGLWFRLRDADEGRRLAALSVRTAGVMLAGSSAYALWHGMVAALCAT
jgi:hypothetical protein